MATALTKSGLICATVALAACGGAGNPFSDDRRAPLGPITTDEAEGIAAAYDSLATRMAALTPTPDGVVPVAGQATFTGLTRLEVAPQGQTETMTFIGDTVVQADFGGPLLGAEMTSFAGEDLSGATMRLDGKLSVDGARIGGTMAGSNEVLGTFRGILLGEGIEINASGTIAGQFLHIPARAISLTGTDTSAIYNDAPASLSLTGFATE